MAVWAKTKSYEVAAPLSIAWRCSIDPEAMAEYLDGFVGYTVVSGTPGAEGSVLAIQLEMSGKAIEYEVTTTKSIEFERIEQTSDTEGMISNSVTEFEPDGFDCTRIKQTMSVDLDGVSLFRRMMIKAVSGMMLFVATDKFIEYAEEQAALELSGAVDPERGATS